MGRTSNGGAIKHLKTTAPEPGQVMYTLVEKNDISGNRPQVFASIIHLLAFYELEQDDDLLIFCYLRTVILPVPGKSDKTFTGNLSLVTFSIFSKYVML